MCIAHSIAYYSVAGYGNYLSQSSENGSKFEKYDISSLKVH